MIEKVKCPTNVLVLAEMRTELDILIQRLDNINKKRKITPWWHVIERFKIYNERQKVEKTLSEAKIKLMQSVLNKLFGGCNK
jgi:hypothetical protein